jgi:hypothetical protein
MDEHNTTATAGNSDPPHGTGEAVPAAQLPADQKVTTEQLLVEELRAERAREAWLRERLEKEHQVTLAFMRLLLVGLSREGRATRFWRWLIDDFRSERRMLADSDRATGEERKLINRILVWLRERGFAGNRGGPDGYSETSGPAK